ncbi:MAG: ChaN family lipoprotein [Gammaproteobacteria bacterium]|nr:ChaN family lipoprotein [Gammaproteobacteria bacterium]MBU1725415.1 ChaN family lipoprotein [Gammaproteobacteria bacterium]MBU2005285.1 ChaN family lipoprotein [Gammaproteobacteria bacterium]
MFQNMHGWFSRVISHRLAGIVCALLGLMPVSTSAVTVNHQTLAEALAYVAEHPPQGVNQDKHLPFPALIDALDQNRVVFVGEVHDRYDHHLNQLALLQALHQRNRNIAIGVEWFQQPFQPVINDFLAGKISEAELLKRSEYYDRWRYDYRLLRPIMEYAKANHLPVIALNAPLELTRKVSGGGLESLSAGERAQLPARITPPDISYRERLQKIFAEHSRDDKEFDNFMLVQRIWDETMAGNIVRYLQLHPQHRMVVFSGSGHISYRSGIPQDVKRQMPGIRLATVTSSDPQEVEPGVVDYFILSKMLELPRSGKLGVWLKSASNGIHIGEMQDGSAAKKAGLQSGDRIASLNEKAVGGLADLMLALASHKPGEKVSVAIERSGIKGLQTFSVILQ